MPRSFIKKEIFVTVVCNLLKFKDKCVEIKIIIDFGGNEKGENIVRMLE